MAKVRRVVRVLFTYRTFEERDKNGLLLKTVLFECHLEQLERARETIETRHPTNERKWLQPHFLKVLETFPVARSHWSEAEHRDVIWDEMEQKLLIKLWPCGDCATAICSWPMHCLFPLELIPLASIMAKWNKFLTKRAHNSQQQHNRRIFFHQNVKSSEATTFRPALCSSQHCVCERWNLFSGTENNKLESSDLFWFMCT